MCPITPEVEGAKRARSASEAFLYRRLETLSDTRGRFQLNGDLPIAFDGWGRMEIDLLCTDSRLVVEIDGPQHLADPVAYPRRYPRDAVDLSSDLRAVVFVVGASKKGTSRAGQEYEAPLLVLIGKEYAAMSFQVLHDRLSTVLRGS